METKLIEISKLRLDGDTQPRLAIDQAVVDEYAEAMQAGREFPPVEVFHDGVEYWLADGFHRIHASRKIGRLEIHAIVKLGMQSEAQWSSLAANKDHGLRRTNSDKQKAVTNALRLRPELSDSAIAEHVGVHINTVAKYRSEEAQKSTYTKCVSRTGRDGRKYDVAKIQTKQKRRHEVRISPDAFKPIHGHSKPNPMIAMSLPSHDPVMAARTLIELFDAEYLRALTSHLNDHLKGIS
jgi:hypothetical protein